MKEVRGKADDVGVTLRDERRNIEWKVDWLMFALTNDEVSASQTLKLISEVALNFHLQYFFYAVYQLLFLIPIFQISKQLLRELKLLLDHRVYEVTA